MAHTGNYSHIYFKEQSQGLCNHSKRLHCICLVIFQVSKAYSKTWSYREDALTSVYRQMQEMPANNKEESKSVLRAAIFLVKRGIDDKVYAVSNVSLLV